MAKRVFRVTKDGNFWGLKSGENHLAALAALLNITVNDLPADFPRHFRGNELKVWINNSVYVVSATQPNPTK